MTDIFTMMDIGSPVFLDLGATLTIHEGGGNDDRTVNGFWLYPAENFSTTWQLHAADMSTPTTTAWLKQPIPGCTFSNSSLVARRHASLNEVANLDNSPNSDGNIPESTNFIVGQGSVCIRSTATLAPNQTILGASLLLQDDQMTLIFQSNQVGTFKFPGFPVKYRSSVL